MGKIILFTVVTIFQWFFSLCIVYGSIIPPEYIYYDYHNYAISVVSIVNMNTFGGFIFLLYPPTADAGAIWEEGEGREKHNVQIHLIKLCSIGGILKKSPGCY
jgi:hypothetical protein